MDLGSDTVKPALVVMNAGPLSTLQDRGRVGYLNRGVSPAGPCDPLLHAIANRLAGNDLYATAIEFTLRGDQYKVFANSCKVAVAGDVAMHIDGKAAQPWRCYTLERDQILTIGYLKTGIRGYLAVAGGFDIEPVLGSLSMHVRSGIGPLDGTAFKAETMLPLSQNDAPEDAEREFDRDQLPPASDEIRVVLGPQDGFFFAAELAQFTSQPFAVTPKCDRMGYQISGPRIDYRKDIPLISEGIALGSVQVLSDGLFIVAMADRQTVGGYPKIATIITCDIPILAQARAGTTFRFREIGIEEAQNLYRRRLAFLNTLDSHFRKPRTHTLDSEALLTANLISGVYSAS